MFRSNTRIYLPSSVLFPEYSVFEVCFFLRSSNSVTTVPCVPHDPSAHPSFSPLCPGVPSQCTIRRMCVKGNVIVGLYPGSFPLERSYFFLSPHPPSYFSALGSTKGSFFHNPVFVVLNFTKCPRHFHLFLDRD